jgi:MFS family permease
VKTACTATAAAGVCFLLATLVIASLGGRGRIPGALAVLGAVAIYSVGEILQASASWELSFELAPVSQASEYQSIFTSGLTLGTVIAPVVITEILLSFGDQGWVVLGVIMATLGFVHLIFAHYRPVTAEPLRAVT